MSQMWATTIAQACDGDQCQFEVSVFGDRDTIRAELMITPDGEVTL